MAATTPASEAGSREATTTAERLMDAAERLFAEQGIEQVSIRAVNVAADANVAAVHYHFGSKHNLVEAVLRRRLATIADRRFALLAALPDPPTPRDVAAALVHPLVELGREPDSPGRVYVRFLAALHHVPGAIEQLYAEAFAPQYPPIDAAYARAAPGLSAPLRSFRLQLAGRMAVEAIAGLEHVARRLGLAPGRPGEDTAVEHLVDAVAGTLGAAQTFAAGVPTIERRGPGAGAEARSDDPGDRSRAPDDPTEGRHQ